MELKLEWDASAWDGLKIERVLQRSLSRAGGAAIRAMKIAASRSVRQRKKFKVARINKGLPLDFPKGKDLVWTMRVSGHASPVSDFAIRQTKKGVTARINQGRPSKIGGAFIAILKSGHKGVFLRRGKERLPIDEAFTTRVSDVFKDADLIPDVQARAQKVFSSEFQRLMTLSMK